MEYRATPAYHRCHKYICVSLTGVTSTSVSLSHSLSLSVSLSLSLCLSRGIDAVVCGRGGPFQAQRCSRVFTITTAGSCRAAIPFHNEQTLVGQRASLR